MEISIMHYATETDAAVNVESKITLEAIANFKAANPNITVVEEVVAHDSYEAKLKTLAAGDQLPDIFTALPTFMPTFYDNGQILDIKPLLEADADWNSRFLKGAHGDYEFGDIILGTPKSGIVNHVLLWNRDIFEKCGIKEFPKNSEEFKAAVITLKENGYIPMSAGNKGKFILASQIMPGILMKFASADWYNNVKQYKASFTDPEAVEAITYVDELLKLGLLNDDFNSIEGSQARQMYYDEKAAMYVEGSWVISAVTTDASPEVCEKTNVTIFPTVVGKEDLEGQIVGGQGWGFCLNSKLKDEKLAKSIELLKCLTAPEIQGELVEGGALAVVNNATYDESKLSPLYVKFLEMYKSHPVIVGCPEVQLSTDYMDASYTGYQELSIGQLTPTELAEKLQEAHESAK